ncbi:MAG: hypothetical protein Q7T11_03290 [Deltaproteobacteria bacterium]|nr:hypothetical protein [Deltaproteobacteria bacterium]
MRVESLVSTGTHLILRPPVVQGGGGVDSAATKSLGETPPVVLELSQIGALAALFGKTGFITRLKRRLNYLKNKKCTIVPAQGGNACVDDEDVVYVGVDFIKAYLKEPETIAGVLAHEWGHACALRPQKDSIQKLNWNQIFELRRAHETLADEISGRLLYMLGYTSDGLVRFLTRGKETHNLKYHAPEIRAQVVRYGFEAEKRKAALAKQLFPGTTYKTQYHSHLLDIA